MFTKNFKISQNEYLPTQCGFRPAASNVLLNNPDGINLPYTGTIYEKRNFASNPYINGLVTKISSHTTLDYVGTTSSRVSTGIVFGDGTTPPTENDATLSGNLISGNYINTSDCSFGLSQTIEGDNYIVTQVITVTNNSSTDVTIAEIGIVGNFHFTGTTVNSSSSKYCPILLERTVLDKPVSIPAGGVGKVTYTLTLNGPFFA